MKINDKLISLPPYISTTWDNISTIHMKGTLLVFTLKEGDVISIPGLKQEVIDHIFEAHASYFEKGSGQMPMAQENTVKVFNSIGQQPIQGHLPNEMPFRLGFGAMDPMGTTMQHNPSQSDMPPLPPELISKIGQIAKIIAPDEIASMPKPEVGCNCVYCQIARALIPEAQEMLSPAEEEIVISDEDLQFCQWDISQVGEKLFSVANRLDNNEKYRVFLGEPVGCTCGKQGCEHILAVLKS